ncbi:hypothetical protein EMIHUDRAFT_367684, partial [Emiliania huxleyi CCMP1516]|uniref:Uncharacterized protein n=2 Tax=Emiliania huxleyi TaxID=2903 RepID=A0A0D3JLL6_EMIH1
RSTEQLATLQRDELLKQAEAAEAAARGKHDARPEHPARWQGHAPMDSRDGRQQKRCVQQLRVAGRGRAERENS